MTSLPTDWDDGVIRQYLTPESHQKSRKEFERTHIDINKIRADYLFPHQTNDDFVTQDEFCDAILKSNQLDDNRIFILRGETGSGKSQLCQWLEYQIGSTPEGGRDDTHIALHVSRSQTRIEDIVEILTEPIDVNIQVGNVNELDPNKVADAMVTNLEAYAPAAFQELSKSEVESLIEDHSGRDLRGILSDNLEEYQNAVADEDENDIPDLISKDEYRELALIAFGTARGAETIFPTLRGFLHDELSGKLNVGNFQEKLETISDAYIENGLRPVLICEDLTTFSVLKEQLLDHIFQLDSGHYDVVLGWTTGWEKDDLDKALGTTENTYTYMKDRAEGYLSTTDDTGQAYFLTEDVTVELARKYVSVIRGESSSTADSDIPNDAFDDLYPFNAEFIRRAYEHLVQDGNERRTPRLLLIRIVRECLTSTSPPFESIEGNPYVKQFPTPVDINLPANLQSLAKWYGFPNAEQNIELPRGIVDTFGLSVPTGSEVLDDTDPVVLQGKSGHKPKQDFQLSQTDGVIEPGATLTIEATLNNRNQPDVEVALDGDPVGTTDQSGTIDIDLPSEEGEVTITGNQGNLNDQIDLAVGTDSLNLSASPTQPESGEDVTVEARFNGQPEPGVPIYVNEDNVGTTDTGGTITVNATDPPEMSIRSQKGDVEDEITVQVFEGGVYPVDTDLDSEEIDQRRFEYEQWLKNGEDYPSSDTLRSGAATILEEWYDPTRLSNPNASATGVAGIYYAKGSEVPVSIQSVDERQGLSIELPFGTENNDIFEPLLWCGISSANELPLEDRYELNYDLIQGWVDNQVDEFRRSMREEVESCLPDGWTIEEFIIVGNYLLKNAAAGTTDLTRELVFDEYSTPEEYPHFVIEHFDRKNSYREAYNNLTKSSSDMQSLAEGFFKLKSNFVDEETISNAFESVKSDIESYVQEAMYIDPSGLPDAYRIGTNRSGAKHNLDVLLKRVKQYSQELQQIGSDEIEHVSNEIDEIDAWFDKSHDVVELQDLYGRLYESIGDLDVNIMSRWEENKQLLDELDKLNLAAFQSEVEEFREIENKSGPELIKLLHRFEQSQVNRKEWDIYKSITQMVQRADEKQISEAGGDLERDVRRSDEMKNITELCSQITNLGGGN